MIDIETDKANQLIKENNLNVPSDINTPKHFVFSPLGSFVVLDFIRGFVSLLIIALFIVLLVR